MNNPPESHLKLYSLAIVVKDKVEGSDLIRANPTEQLPFSNGKLKDQKIKNTSKLPDAKGTVKSASVEGKMEVEATWLPLSDSNRISAPDVVEGETVLLLKYSDDDRLYWVTIFRELELRRLEKVLYLFGGTKKKGVKLDRTNSYWLEVDTISGKSQFHTSKANGEPFAYDMIFDSKNGKVSIGDDINNKITIDSHASSASVETNKDIHLKAPKVTVEAEESVFIGKVSVGSDLSVGGVTSTNGVVTSWCRGC